MGYTGGSGVSLRSTNRSAPPSQVASRMVVSAEKPLAGAPRGSARARAHRGGAPAASPSRAVRSSFTAGVWQNPAFSRPARDGPTLRLDDARSHRRVRPASGRAEVHRREEAEPRAVGGSRRRRAGRRRHRRREVDGLCCAAPTSWRPTQFVPATIAEYCGWSVELRRARRPRRRRRRSAWCGGPPRPSSSACARSWCVPTPSRPHAPRSPHAPPARRPPGLRRVEQRVGLTPGRVRDPVRQPRPELRLRDVRPALPRPLRLGRAQPGPRSPPTSGRARAPTPTPSSSASPSRSTTCSRRR